MTPFRLVFGIEAVVPMEYVIPSLRLSVQHRMSSKESISHRQKELLKLEEDRIQSAYLMEVGQKRRQAWMFRQVKVKIFQIISEQGQGTFLLKDVFGTQILKPVNGFRLKTFYGKVPKVPKWMINKAEDIVSKLVTISVMWVAPEFLEESLATCGGNLKPVEGSGIWNSECGTNGGILIVEVEVQREERPRNGIGQNDQGVLISAGTYFKAKTAPSAEVTHLRTNIFWVNLAWRAQIEVKIHHYKYKVARSDRGHIQVWERHRSLSVKEDKGKMFFANIKGKLMARMQDAVPKSMPHTRSMKMVMEELLKLCQQEEHIEGESEEAESISEEESVEMVVAAFDPNQEETHVWLKRIGLYEFACLPWDAWAKNKFAEQQCNMIKEGDGVITGDVRLTPRLVSKVFKVLHVAVPAKGRKLKGKRDRRRTSAVGRVAPYLAAIFEHVLKVSLGAASLKTPVADVLKKEGTISGMKWRKLLLGSPIADKSKSPFSISWKDLEEPETKVDIFNLGSESKKSESKVEVAANCLDNLNKFLQDQDVVLRVLENAKLEHKCTAIPEWKMQIVELQLLQVKSDKERLQEEVMRIIEEAMARNAEILSVAKDFTRWADGLKTTVDEQFKELGDKVADLTTENDLLVNRLAPLADMERAALQNQGITGILVVDSNVDALKKELLEYAQEMWNESIRRENEALKMENGRLVAEMEELKNKSKGTEVVAWGLSKWKPELSSGVLEPDQNLAAGAESKVEKQEDPDVVAEKAVEADAKEVAGEQTT
ncbi:hypothetical protein L7F22_031743 [Adiantum nelumboides]|nr:hypothetical protein [Adiantum nelumboides]